MSFRFALTQEVFKKYRQKPQHRSKGRRYLYEKTFTLLSQRQRNIRRRIRPLIIIIGIFPGGRRFFALSSRRRRRGKRPAPLLDLASNDLVEREQALRLAALSFAKHSPDGLHFLAPPLRLLPGAAPPPLLVVFRFRRQAFRDVNLVRGIEQPVDPIHSGGGARVSVVAANRGAAVGPLTGKIRAATAVGAARLDVTWLGVT
jgi:hypothetical protein